MSSAIDSFVIFTDLSSKITQLLYTRSTNDRTLINRTLDELNTIDYSYPVVSVPTKAVLLLHQCCSLIPPEDTELVQKCSVLFTSLITKQMVLVEGRTLTMAVQWCLQALKSNDNRDVIGVFSALEALLKVNKSHELTVEVIKFVIEIARNEKDLDSVLAALQCLDTCITPFDESGEKFNEQLRICFEVFLGRLLTFEGNATKINEIKILTICLHGIQNVITQKPEVLKENIGTILGIIQTYMVFNLRGVDFINPRKLLPSTLNIPEPAPNINPREKGGKLTKLRKQRAHKGNSTKPKSVAEKSNNVDYNNSFSGYLPANAIGDPIADVGGAFGRLKTSDSDFSDSEGGNLAKLAITAGRTRQAALSLFLYITKAVEKNVMFSYWSSFIPENFQASGKHNLPTCILKDTSAKGRIIALQVLQSLITNAKLYLAQAEKGESLAFTPFSVIIGLTIKQLHKCLSLALTEHSIPVLAQVFKCWSGLVQTTPYHKLSPGLLTRAVRNVKVFVDHKDATIQVAALIVLGCALASEPCVPETKIAFFAKIDQKPDNTPRNEVKDDLEYADFSSDDEEDSVIVEEMPWILEKALRNLGVVTKDGTVNEGAVTTVKLESLQVISAICRNYFASLLAKYLVPLTAKALNLCLRDKYPDVQLHAGRAIDFIGQAMTRYFLGEIDPEVLSLQEGLAFWQTLLNGELAKLVQVEGNPVLRAVGCDCLGSIGALIFEQLPRDKQILCITLLFAASRDDENNVKGAAVRSIGISVLYPSLREDLGFVMDATETISRLIRDENLGVRIKASWSLGNLSEALALNKANPNLMEEFPKNRLLKLVKTTVESAENNDKIRMNIVRALGGFLNLITEDLLDFPDFKESVGRAFGVLVANCTTGSNMKVRWNSCYAMGNAMKNPALFSPSLDWKSEVFGRLCDLVVNFRNFKVRTNACFALSSPGLRRHYGGCYFGIWGALVKALETSQNMEDFSEYKHRDHLVEQICLSMGHLTTLLNREDLFLFKDNVTLDPEFLKGHMMKVSDRLLPEKSTILFDAQTHLNILGNEPSLSEDQKFTLKQLDAVFKLDF